MIPFIRAASDEEISKIKEGADLTSTSAVWAWENNNADHTPAADLAVVRQSVEIDPVHFDSSSGHQRKLLYFWALCSMLKVLGTHEVYFNVDAEGNDNYISILEKMGASRLTQKPQFRFKLAI